jgi:hypothetical protein
MQELNIPVDLIRGHEEISPGRKVDPGSMFDWDRVRSAVTSTSVPGPPSDLVDEDGDGVIYIDETDDVNIPDGRDRSWLGRLFNSIFSIFR